MGFLCTTVMATFDGVNKLIDLLLVFFSSVLRKRLLGLQTNCFKTEITYWICYYTSFFSDCK